MVPTAPELRGELRFHFADGLRLHCLVYLAHGYEGMPRETEEAIPLWFSVDALPYDEMWEDDRRWLPLLLAGQQFTGIFTVNGEEVIENSLTFCNIE